jgi:hypothetical protein
LVETNEHNLIKSIAFLQFSNGFPERNPDRQIDGKPIGAATNGGEGERPQTVLSCNLKARPIATGE